MLVNLAWKKLRFCFLSWSGAFSCHQTLAKVMSEHLSKQHQIEVEHGGEDEEEELRSSNHLPRKRVRPRGPGRKNKKLMRENSEGQVIQMESSKQQDSGENDQGQDVQREGMKQQDSLPGNRCNQSEGTSSLAQLPTRKRSWS